MEHVPQSWFVDVPEDEPARAGQTTMAGKARHHIQLLCDNAAKRKRGFHTPVSDEVVALVPAQRKLVVQMHDLPELLQNMWEDKGETPRTRVSQ